MKAIILSAGLGTRLGDLAKNIPKCLLKINSKTILETWIEMLNKCYIEDISVVIGAKGSCWTKENQEKVKKIVKNIVINPKNTETGNAYSLRLALKNIQEDEILISDGDLILNSDLLKKILETKKSLILSKESHRKDDPRNKIIADDKGRVLEMGKHIPKEKLFLPHIVYGALIKIQKKHFDIFKKLINNEKYYNLSLNIYVNDLCKKIDLYKITDSRWININKEEELEEAKKLCLENS